jgi:hypothetical protein
MHLTVSSNGRRSGGVLFEEGYRNSTSNSRFSWSGERGTAFRPRRMSAVDFFEAEAGVKQRKSLAFSSGTRAKAAAGTAALYLPCGKRDRLLQITLNDFDQVFCCQRTGGIRLPQRIDDLRPDVVFQDFGHKSVDGASRAGDEPQQVGTSDVLFECPFDGFDLTANPAHAVHHFGLFPI